jgi:hypothetical protein
MAFLWACSRGARGYILLLALLSAAMSAIFEALMFAMLGRIVDWLGKRRARRLWIDHGTTLTVLAGSWWPASWWWRCRPSSSTRRWPSTSRCGCAGTFTA